MNEIIEFSSVRSILQIQLISPSTQQLSVYLFPKALWETIISRIQGSNTGTEKQQ